MRVLQKIHMFFTCRHSDNYQDIIYEEFPSTLLFIVISALPSLWTPGDNGAGLLCGPGNSRHASASVDDSQNVSCMGGMRGVYLSFIWCHYVTHMDSRRTMKRTDIGASIECYQYFLM